MSKIKTILVKERIKAIPAYTGSFFRKFGKIILDIAWQGAFILGIVILIMWYPIHWLTKPIPTQIQVELITDHISFQLTKATELRQPLKFYEATLRHFEQLTFHPSTIVEQNLSSLNTVQIKPKLDERFFPKIILKTTTPASTNFGVLNQLNIAAGAKLRLDVKPGAKNLNELSFAIENKPAQNLSNPSAILQHVGPFQVTTDYCQMDNGQLPSHFEVKALSRKNPKLEITGQPEQLKLAFSLSKEQTVELLPRGISITALDLSWQDMIKGQRVINYATLKQGTIRYPAYSSIAPINFDQSNLIAFGKNDTFQIEAMTLTPDSNNIKLRFVGLANEPVTTFLRVAPEISIERRLTRSEVYPETSKFYKVLFEVILWFIPIIIGIIGIVTINIVKILPNNQQQQQN
jgi:hypothetical protein